MKGKLQLRCLLKSEMLSKIHSLNYSRAQNTWGVKELRYVVDLRFDIYVRK